MKGDKVQVSPEWLKEQRLSESKQGWTNAPRWKLPKELRQDNERNESKTVKEDCRRES